MFRRATLSRPLRTLAVASGALLAAPHTPRDAPLDFESLGNKLLETADAAAQQPAQPGATLLERLTPLHQRLTLGAIELWVPERVLDSSSKFEDGPRAKELAPLVVGLLELERQWLRRMVYSGAELAAANAAVDALIEWANGSKRLDPRDDGPGLQSIQRIERALLLSGPTRNPEHLHVILAPTRAHYLGLLGAAGIVDAKERTRLWRDDARNASGDGLGVDATIVALCTAARPKEAPLEDYAFEVEERVQWVVHQASHLLSMRLVPSSPTWWSEGLAIGDTISVAGADETLCTGFSLRVELPNTYASAANLVFMWVTRDVSPYRDGPSASWFETALRKARTPTGFVVLDLATEKPAFDLPGPFLGAEYAPDSRVVNSGLGVKRGFAEFYRAYCSAFVHWLDTRAMGDHSLLAEICRELAGVPFDAKAKRSPLYAVVQMITDKALGQVYDAKLDLEGEFMATLTR